MKNMIRIGLTGLLFVFFAAGTIGAQNKGLPDRISQLENQVRLLTERIASLEASSKLIIWSAYSTEQGATARYTPNVIEFSTADDFVGPMDVGDITILKSGYYHLKFFQSFQVYQRWDILHGELSASLRVNNLRVVRVPFHLGISVNNTVNYEGPFWNDEFNGTIMPYYLEGVLSGVIYIDKIIYFSEGDRFCIELPHHPRPPFKFNFQQGENGMQIRFLGQ